MSVSNFTSATFSVVKKYTQLVCIGKISHCKSTLKFACKKSACKSSCRNLHASFLRGLFGEIRHIARNLRTCKCCNVRGLYCMRSLWLLTFIDKYYNKSINSYWEISTTTDWLTCNILLKGKNKFSGARSNLGRNVCSRLPKPLYHRAITAKNSFILIFIATTLTLNKG